MKSSNPTLPMDSVKFVSAIKIAVKRDAINATRSTLESPPGRDPDPKDVELSNFYLSLPKNAQKKITDIIEMAVNMATFEFLCVLDGVKSIEGIGEKGTLELRYMRGELNININEDTDLHDIYFSIDQED